MSKHILVAEAGSCVRIELREHGVVLFEGTPPGKTRRERFRSAAALARQKLRQMKAEAYQRIALDTALLYMPVRAEPYSEPF